MQGYLLDTNVLVELFSLEKRKPNPNVANWFRQRSTADVEFYISIVSILENYSGAFNYHRFSLDKSANAATYTEARRRSNILFRLCKDIQNQFKDFTLDLTMEVMKEWTKILSQNTELYKSSNLSTSACNDVLIGATANLHDLTVVTRNENDFKNMNLKHELVNPFR